MIITRQDPPFSLARLRARAEVLEIRSDDLRFSEDETSQFLKSRLDLTPDEAVVSALHSRSEGWIA